MFFILIVFMTALLMEGIGSYISVIGLNATFAGNAVILAMAVTLDIAKIVTVSIVYKYWTKLSKLALCYMIPAIVITMSITSYGAFGYLSSAFQVAVAPNKEVTTRLSALETERSQLVAEKESLIARKGKIDEQIANLPPDMVRGRTRLINSFKPEIEQINSDIRRASDRVVQITAEIPALRSENIGTQQHVGPVAFISESFGISMEGAIKYVILVLVLVFDPLAVMLVISGNFMLRVREAELEEKRLKDVDETKAQAAFDREEKLERLRIEKERAETDREVAMAHVALEGDKLDLEAQRLEQSAVSDALETECNVVSDLIENPGAVPEETVVAAVDHLEAAVDKIEKKKRKKRHSRVDEPHPRNDDPAKLGDILKLEAENVPTPPEEILKYVIVDKHLSTSVPETRQDLEGWKAPDSLNYYSSRDLVSTK